MRVVEGTDVDKRLAPRTLVMGVDSRWKISGVSVSRRCRSKARSSISVGSTPIVVVLGDDRRSVRAFETNR